VTGVTLRGRLKSREQPIVFLPTDPERSHANLPREPVARLAWRRLASREFTCPPGRALRQALTP
jgi:hypothetical protein